VIDASQFQRLIQQPSSGAHEGVSFEGVSFEVFIVARLLSDEHCFSLELPSPNTVCVAFSQRGRPWQSAATLRREDRFGFFGIRSSVESLDVFATDGLYRCALILYIMDRYAGANTSGLLNTRPIVNVGPPLTGSIVLRERMPLTAYLGRSFVIKYFHGCNLCRGTTHLPTKGSFSSEESCHTMLGWASCALPRRDDATSFRSGAKPIAQRRVAHISPAQHQDSLISEWIKEQSR
jgi:hypothetical protein